MKLPGKFGLLSDYVPAYPFDCLPEIALRARELLQSKTDEQASAIAARIKKEVNSYFEDALHVGVGELRSKLSPGDEEFEQYFDWDGASSIGNGRWTFKECMADELGIPTEGNTYLVDALKRVMEKRDDSGFFLKEEPPPEVFREGKDYEFFAVAALEMIASTICCAQEVRESLAGGIAIKAMEAICHAENLRNKEWLVFHVEYQAQKSLKKALHDQKLQLAESDRQRQSKKAQDLNALRHKETHETQSLVTSEWEKEPSRFPSAEQAGAHFADWLESQKIGRKVKGEFVPYQPRTITDWIRKHAKNRGIKLR
jgi:hypothetical protein